MQMTPANTGSQMAPSPSAANRMPTQSLQLKQGHFSPNQVSRWPSYYKNNQNPHDIITALCDSYGCPTPAEKEANEMASNMEWDPMDPIEAFFDQLEDCFITAFIAKLPFTKPQLIDKAICAIQCMGLYNRP